MQKKGLKSKVGKWLVPILGLALLVPSATPVLAAAPPKVKAVEFIGMDAPANIQEMSQVYSNAVVQVSYTDGSSKTFPLTYKTLYKSNDVINGTPAGLAIDVNGNAIMDNSVSGSPTPFVSDGPDANGLLNIAGVKPTIHGGNPLSLLTHFEYITLDHAGKSAYGLVPASVSLSSVDQNKKTGALKVVDLKKIDFSSVGGIWIPCNGSVTPWNTFLSSEEYEPDARQFEADPNKTYVGSFTKFYYQDDTRMGNPYAYGFLPEVTVNADQSTSVVKHYSMGRFSHELGRVAADRKTVFFGDDGGNTMLFLYVADDVEDLSAGALYAAKWVQTSDENGGSANLEWIRLGHASDDEIKAYINSGIKFSDIFETADQDTESFIKIKTYPSGKTEWLKVKTGMEQAAAFLEPRRYGAFLGATSEFNKMEGLAVNEKDNKLYVAMSYVEKGMEKDSKGTDPTDHIQVKKIKAGVTYELALHGGQSDSGGQTINSVYVPATMKGLVVGEDLPKADEKGNTAVVDKVANPDNLAFSESMRTLFIGEDSGMHANNFVWAYNIDTGKLSRILSVPAGAEATGLQVYDDVNGFSYVLSNVQHPGDEMILPDALKSQVSNLIDQNFDHKKAGVIGYVSGLPQLEGPLAADEADSIVAVRELCEKNGAKVEWIDSERKVVISKGHNTLTMKIGESKITINGQEKPISQKVRLIGGKTMAPSQIIQDFVKM